MLQYLIQMPTIEGKECHVSLSAEDSRRIRAASAGRPFDLENYVAYLTANQQLALSRRPAHGESVVVSYGVLCRKLTEAEIEDGERGPER